MIDEYTKYPRGAEWRRWDLHFHTPSSHDYKNKSITNQEIIDELEANGVSVVAITDHHIIDIVRISDLQKLGAEKNITVLPGIEFLSESRGSDPIHFIAIFPEKENFNLSHVWDQISAKTNLVKIVSEEKSPNEVYCNIEKTSELVHELGGIVTIHAGSKTNTIDNITNSLPHGVAQKEDIASCIDIFELGKPDDISPYENLVCKHLKRDVPLIIASDNHNIKDYKVKVNCWIKADPTFEGLKQVLHEPRERVKIQEGNPNEKSGYKVIDRIERYRTKEDSEPFQVIPLNPNLNCIIGGRSTGKSVLARSIAYRMDYEDKALEKEIQEYKNWFTAEAEKIRVIWTDDSEESKREVEYYPQSFMYDIARKNDDRNKLVQNILEEHGKSQFIEEHSQKEKEISEDIHKLITNLFSQIGILETKKTNLRQLGEKKGVEKEIAKLKEDLVTNGGTSLSSKEQELFNTQTSVIRTNETKISSYRKDLDEINLLRSERVMTHNLDSRIKLLSEDKAINVLQQTLKDISSRAQDEWGKKIDVLVNQYEGDIKKSKDLIASIKDNIAFKKATEALSKTTLSNSIQKRLGEQEKASAVISLVSQESKNLEKSISDLRGEILDKHSAYGKVGDEFANKINLKSSGLSISTRLHTGRDQLKETWEAVVSLKSKSSKDISVKAELAPLLPRAEVNNYFMKAFEAILDNQVSIKSGFDQETGLKNLFAKSPYSLDFDIRYEEDSYTQMSDGKKAFVILKLLLEFSSRECPIILDQPEDDLDNRSIYTDLVSYLKQKKVDRQIITVTHNANIAVGADSELIIVANQDSEKTKNRTGEKFEYIGGSIEHSFCHDDSIKYTLESQGTREHVCEILEGGNEAFKVRERKYGIK